MYGSGHATVRIAPPLVISSEQASNGAAIFERACSDVAERGVAPFHPILAEHEAGPETPEGT